MISGWRASAPRRPSRCSATSAARADDPVVRVGRAARGRTGHGPAVQRVAVVLERRRARAAGTDDVVDEDAAVLDDVVAGVADRYLDCRARVRRRGRRSTARSRRWRRSPRPRPGSAAARRPSPVASGNARGTGAGQPEGADEAGVLAGVAVVVGQRGPVVLRRRACASTNTKSQSARCRGDPERQLRPPAGTPIVRARRL